MIQMVCMLECLVPKNILPENPRGEVPDITYYFLTTTNFWIIFTSISWSKFRL